MAVKSGAVLVLSLTAVAAFEAPPSRLEGRQVRVIDSQGDPVKLRENRAEITIGRMIRDPRELGCAANLAVAFRESRSTDSLWAAQFTVHDRGRGAWRLSIEDAAERPLWARDLDSVPAGQVLETELVSNPSIRIVLRGPGSGAVCPKITLDAELKLFPRSQPRGVFDVDDRWPPNHTDLRAEADAKVILGWSIAVVKLVTRADDGSLLPCSAFFVSRHALMTASHCASFQSEVSRGKLFLANGEIAGSELELLIVQGDLDFSVIWVPTEQPVPPLVLTADSGNPGGLVVWQHPVDVGKVVSVKGCTVSRSEFMFMQHRCDTAVGTSGAPIQARGGGGVVAVHTNGCTAQTDGTTRCRNFGTRMSSILGRLKDLTADIQREHPTKAVELLAAFDGRP